MTLHTLLIEPFVEFGFMRRAPGIAAVENFTLQHVAALCDPHPVLG